MNESLNAAVVLVLGVAWVLCIIFGCRNLIRVGKSPHWMWLSLCSPLATLVIFGISIVLVQNQKSALARQEAQREDERRRQEVEARRRAAEQHAASQRALSTRLGSLVSDSTQSATSLPTLMRSAEERIDLAEQEFEDGAFAPFWDAVEQAANKLANFEATVQRLIQNSQFYNGEASKLETPAPPFQIGLDTLPDASHTANRMRAVVRRAQKDFHFATIYEQRKTNQLLVAGFSTLGQAIVELGDRLDSSLDHLASAVSISISDLSSDITSSHEHMTSQLTAELERSREQAASDSEAQREHERKEREMLDNIQRRRRPTPPGLRDGEF